MKTCAACGTTRDDVDMGSSSRGTVTHDLCHPGLSEGPTCYSTYASDIHRLRAEGVIPPTGDPALGSVLNRIAERFRPVPTSYGTPFSETEALLSASVGDFENLDRLLADMGNGELTMLRNAARVLIDKIEEKQAR